MSKAFEFGLDDVARFAANVLSLIVLQSVIAKIPKSVYISKTYHCTLAIYKVCILDNHFLRFFRLRRSNSKLKAQGFLHHPFE